MTMRYLRLVCALTLCVAGCDASGGATADSADAVGLTDSAAPAGDVGADAGSAGEDPGPIDTAAPGDTHMVDTAASEVAPADGTRTATDSTDPSDLTDPSDAPDVAADCGGTCDPGAIQGTALRFGLVDGSGITVTATAGGAPVTVEASADGSFALPTLAPGTYTVTAALDPYAPVTISDVAVTAGATTTVGPLTLKLGTRLVDGADVSPIGMTADGLKVLYLLGGSSSGQSGELWVFDRQLNLASLLGKDVWSSAVWTSADSTKVAFLTGYQTQNATAAELWISDLGTATGNAIAEHVHWNQSLSDASARVQFNADWTRAAFVTDYVSFPTSASLAVWAAGDAHATTLGQDVDPYSVMVWPDWSWIRFAGGCYAGVCTLTVWDLAAGAAVLEAENIRQYSVSQSPAWSLVAYVADYDDAAKAGALHVLGKATGEDKTVALGVPEGPYFSPNDDRLVFVSAYDAGALSGELHLLDVETGVVTLLGYNVHYVCQNCGAIRFDPTWTRVTFLASAESSGVGVLTAFDLTTGTSAIVGSGVGAWSTDSDGTRLLYLEAYDPDTGIGELGIWDLATGVGGPVGGHVFGANLSIGPGATHFLFLADATVANGVATGTLRVWDLGAGTATEIATGVSSFGLQGSPDGTRAAYLTNYQAVPNATGDLWAWQSGVGSTPLGAVSASSSSGGPTPSPGWSQLLFMSAFDEAAQTGALAVFDFDAKSTTPIATGASRWLQFVADGHEVLYFAAGDLWRWSFAAGAADKLGAQVDVPSLRLSPDGFKVLFTANFSGWPWGGVGDLWLWDFGSDAHVQLGGAVSTVALLIDPDWTRALFLTNYDPSAMVGDLHTVDLLTGDAALLGEDVFRDQNTGSGVFVSPDWASVYYLVGASTVSGDLRLHRFADESTVDIAEHVATQTLHFAGDWASVVFLEGLVGGGWPQTGTLASYTVGAGAQTPIDGDVTQMMLIGGEVLYVVKTPAGTAADLSGLYVAPVL